MPEPYSDNRFVFRSPFVSSIYPISSPGETLSLLHEINTSRPPAKRLPVEILLYVNRELHRNSLLEDIRATWNPITGAYKDQILGLRPLRLDRKPLEPVVLDMNAKRYRVLEKLEKQIFPWDPYVVVDDKVPWGGISVYALWVQISSADLLYRLRCYFPEVNVNSDSDGQHVVWKAFIKHNESGLLLKFSEWIGASGIEVSHYDDSHGSLFEETEDSIRRDVVLNGFRADSTRLFNALFSETADYNHRRFAYYHPAADAEFSANCSDEHYIAVPIEILSRQNFSYKFRDTPKIYGRWRFKQTSATDVSSFPSLLQELKYDVASRKVDRLNGTTNLTTVMSSALLFYRLVCKYKIRHCEYGDVNEVSQITSVWQVQLAHHQTKASIIFMDDHGLFDIRGGEGIDEVMDDVKDLVDSLCSDTCLHPYSVDKVVAGYAGTTPTLNELEFVDFDDIVEDYYEDMVVEDYDSDMVGGYEDMVGGYDSDMVGGYEDMVEGYDDILVVEGLGED